MGFRTIRAPFISRPFISNPVGMGIKKSRFDTTGGVEPLDMNLSLLADTYVNEDNPNTNYNNSPALEYSCPGGTRCRILIKPDLSPLTGINVPPNTKFTLYLYKYENYYNYCPVTLCYTVEDWDADTVTWNNQPIVAPLHTQLTTYQSGVWETYDITEYVLNVLSGNIPNYGLMIKPTYADGYHSLFRSKEAADHQPYIRVKTITSCASPSSVINGGFETGDLTGWDWDIDGPATLTVSDTYPHISGDYAAYFHLSGAYPGYVWISQPVDLTCSATLSLWIKLAGTFMDTYLNVYIDDELVFRLRHKVYTGYYMYIDTADITGTHVIKLHLSPNEGDVYVDDIKCELVPPPRTYHTATLDIAADTDIDQNRPTQNHGDWSSTAYRDDSGYIRKALIKPDLSSILTKITELYDATLYLYKYYSPASTSGKSVSCLFIEEDWDEYTATWNNKPAEGSTISTATDPPANNWISFDITEYVQAILNGTHEDYGVIIRPTTIGTSSQTCSANLYSREAADHQPYVKIFYV